MAIYCRCSPVLSEDAGTLEYYLFLIVIEPIHYAVFSMLSDARIPFKRHWVQNKEVSIEMYRLKMQHISKFKHLKYLNSMYLLFERLG